jgi:predicted esterase
LDFDEDRVYIDTRMRHVTLCAALFAAAASLRATEPTELKDDAGKTIIKYVVELPDGIAPASTTDPAKQVGLILCFPEHDQAVDSDVFPVRQALTRLGLRDQYVLLAGGPQERKFGMNDMEPLEKLIAWAKKTYPINPRRVYMFGKGEGGKISAEFAMTHPNLVTAAITHSWGFWVMPSELTEAIDFQNAAPEIYMNLGHRDLASHLTTVRDTYPRIKAKGYHVIYREFEDMGARSYFPASNEDSIAWATRLRNKNIAPSAEEMKLLKVFATAAPAPVNGYYPTLALVGGATAGGVLQKLFESKDANVRAAAAETCSHGLFGEANAAALGKLTTDPSPKVRSAAIRALGIIANWRYQPAQKALIALAMDKSATTEDRVAATDSLGYAVRLQIRGVRQDPPMFAALVALQSDKDEPVRAAASAILAPAYQPTGASSRAPGGWWQNWLAEITAKEAGYLKDFEVCSGEATVEAVDLFCKAGSQTLGYDLRTGQRVKKDLATAFRQMSQAAEKGYVPAQAHLGMLYANGKGVEQDYRLARQWFAKAGEAGHALAKDSATYGRGAGGVRPPAAAPAPAQAK